MRIHTHTHTESSLISTSPAMAMAAFNFRGSVLFARNLKAKFLNNRGLGSTTPKGKPQYSAGGGGGGQQGAEAEHSRLKLKQQGEYAPVYMALGLILLSTSLGLLTGNRFLLYAPDVRVRKSRREKLTEVEEPEKVTEEAEKFFKSSFFRRLAHVQQSESTTAPRRALQHPRKE
ncbi:hypothetical protein Dimus_007221 [Dionaea muscipula]